MTTISAADLARSRSEYTAQELLKFALTMLDKAA